MSIIRSSNTCENNRCKIGLTRSTISILTFVLLSLSFSQILIPSYLVQAQLLEKQPPTTEQPPTATTQPPVTTKPPVEEGPSGTQAQAITLEPSYDYAFKLMPEPPTLSEKELLILEETVEGNNPQPPPVPEGEGEIIGPEAGTETSIKTKVIQEGQQQLQQPSLKPTFFQSISDGDFRIFASRPITPTARSTVSEPSVANSGSLVFFTGNIFAGRSEDNGRTWQYINSRADNFPNAGDQDIIYSNRAQKFIWYRQGTDWRFSLGTSSNGIDWLFYNRAATGFFPDWNVEKQGCQGPILRDGSRWENRYWWDYPQLALTNAHLFISTDVMLGCTTQLSQNGQPILGNRNMGAIVLRFNLDELRTGARPLHLFAYYDRNIIPNFGLAQGATDTMYWAAHLSSSRMGIYMWNDNTINIQRFDRDIPRWERGGPFNCPVSEGGTSSPQSNWCAHSKNFITNGWVYNGKVGFFWNVRQGSGFNWPYVNSATFSTRDLSYIGRPYIWNPNYAWMYAFASPNQRGLGVAAWFGGGNYYPSVAAGMDDNFNGNPPGWEVYGILTGEKYPPGNRMGDYLRIRPFMGQLSNLWIGSAYVIDNNGVPLNTYFVLGRTIDAQNNEHLIDAKSSGMKMRLVSMR